MKDVRCSVIIQWRDEDGKKRATLGSVPTPTSHNRDYLTDNEVAGTLAHHIARMLAGEVDEKDWGIVPEDVDLIDNLYEFYRSGGLFHPEGHWKYKK